VLTRNARVASRLRMMLLGAGRGVAQGPAATTRSEPAPGLVIYDVGQALSGWATVSVETPVGTAIEILRPSPAR
jgi:hypothetical protein